MAIPFLLLHILSVCVCADKGTHLFKDDELKLIRDEKSVDIDSNMSGDVSLFCRFGGLGKTTDISMTIESLSENDNTLIFKKKLTFITHQI